MDLMITCGDRYFYLDSGLGGNDGSLWSFTPSLTVGPLIGVIGGVYVGSAFSWE